jgi:hypothetical protein
MTNNRIATYNWGAAYLTASGINVVINEGRHMDKAEVIATAASLGLVITKTVKSVRNYGFKGHQYAVKAVA